ncbi:MAG: Tex family protein [Polyangiales bacterium]
MTDATPDPTPALAAMLDLPSRGVAAVVKLLEEGATVPFIARYRKEATGGLDEVQIRAIQEARDAWLQLEARRRTVLAEIEKQGALTPALERAIRGAQTKQALEDLYLPYKPKRRTRATMARERGLEPLAKRILAQPDQGDPFAEAKRFVRTDGAAETQVPDVDAALAGARDIVAEAVSENAEVRALVRETYEREAVVQTRAVASKTKERTKFEQYYDHREPLAKMPSHRFLAIARGKAEGVLRVGTEIDEARLLPRVERVVGLRPRSPFARVYADAIADSLSRLVGPSVENDVTSKAQERAHREAVEVFAKNLEALLLAAPLGGKPVLGIDPGFRTGCKCVVVDETGRFVENATIYLGQGAHKEDEAARVLRALVKKHRPVAVAVGNGTGGREAEAFARQTLEGALVVSVNEAGASVYSASDVAREEFPELDLTVRGAISIARRLQDPLAELVKITPESIGVGQYQHDVDAKLLSQKLGEVVESCVNRVGVELNTASASLLAYVAGLGEARAKKIVAHREEVGRFESRAALKKVGGIGPRTFEQCAGFVRVTGGAHPLDASAVHPERYALVEKIARDMKVALRDLVGHAEQARRIDVGKWVGEGVGEPTLRDIVGELEKPGRDPRASFEPPKFRDDVRELEDLREGMVLEGIVTNVTTFGAFVDVGVHQDGLVHVSKLADRFVRDPNEVVRPGDRITVKVLEVDRQRRRISLSARSADR